MTAMLDGKRVLDLPRETQEVRNAFATYEAMPQWRADSEADLLKAHDLLMRGLMDDVWHMRQRGVGIYREDDCFVGSGGYNVDELIGQL